jgi:hypothetical protein
MLAATDLWRARMHNTALMNLPDPRARAGTAFERFIGLRVALATARIDDGAAWEHALRQCLDSDDMINIEARVQFEGMIAHLLAQGWQPGHHMLLTAANKVFDWDSNSDRLHQFGPAGVLIDQANNESDQFATQPLKDYTTERDVLDRLRLLQVPADYYLRRYIPSVERMLERYPAFIAITVSPEPIAQWQARNRALPPALDRRRGPEPAWLRVVRQCALSTTARWVVMASVSIGLVCLVLNGLGPTPKRVHRHATRAPAQVEFPVDRPAEPSPIEQLNKRQLDEIESRIHYRPTTMPSAPLKVAFIVYVSPNGELAFLGRYLASGDPAFDEAVAAAIHETKRFAASSLSYKFPFIYSWSPDPRPAR